MQYYLKNVLIDVADIIKFSKERISNYDTYFPTQRVPLEIETLGKDGLRYRFSHQLRAKRWINLTSYKISYVLDAAGSGDWFSAGVISRITKHGLIGFKNCNKECISKALKYGQALGALNCFFDGARGLMYSLNKNQVESMVKMLQRSTTPLTLIKKMEDFKPIEKISIRSLY